MQLAGSEQSAADARRSGGAFLRDLGADELSPDRPAGRAWATFLRAHAFLVRRLDRELEEEAGMPLADFDVLMQLALADAQRLRMAELAERALISRSGMTRRVERLAAQGLVRRGPDDADRRAVVVSLTDAAVDRLRAAIPVHGRGVTEHFARVMDEVELECLDQALRKVLAPRSDAG